MNFESLLLSRLMSPSREDVEHMARFWQNMTERERMIEEFFGPSFSTIPSHSPVAIRKMADGRMLMDKARDAVTAKHYERAIDLYTKALNIIAKIDDRESVAEVLRERSEVFLTQRQLHRAEHDGVMGFWIMPECGKIRWQIIKCKRALKDFQAGYHACYDYFENFTLQPEHLAEFVSSFIFMAKEYDGMKMLRQDVKRVQWQGLLDKLVSAGHWASIKDLVLDYGGQNAVVTEYRASRCILSKLVTSCKLEEWKKWGEKLCIALIQHGAPYQSLCEEGKYALHAALRTAIKTGTSGLVEYLLDQIVPSGDRERVDKVGNTLLHLACKGKYSSKTKTIKYLLDRGFDPKFNNRSGVKPLDLLRDDAINRKVVLEAIGCNEDSDGACSSDTSFSKSDKSAVEPTLLKNHPQAGSWSKSQVKQWFSDHNVQRLAGLDGPLLVELRQMQELAPEFFLHTVQDVVNMPLVDVLRLSAALRQL